MERHSFACPTCGSVNVTPIASKIDRALLRFPEEESTTEPVTTYALQCDCGVAFTETVRESQADKPVLNA